MSQSRYIHSSRYIYSSLVGDEDEDLEAALGLNQNKFVKTF